MAGNVYYPALLEEMLQTCIFSSVYLTVLVVAYTVNKIIYSLLCSYIAKNSPMTLILLMIWKD